MKKQILLSIFGATMLSATMNAQGQDPFLGQIAFVGFNFAPVGWAECNGQLLPIAQNTALFSLLGTQYGGNGTTNFALPDMRGRVVVHSGQGPQLSIYNQGQTGGVESVTLTQGEMPTHTHLVNAVTVEGNDASPTGNLPANTKTLDKEYSNAVANTTMKSTMLNPTGGSLPHENRPPYLALKCIIALQGIYPSRP
ncbi:Microcystin-dependent protein [Kaistella chaponensis]|uniref:Microcystin-dependent protein n=1 Tax=Kaistella chaponensis TaxID=713588 RepID=A0A1N7M172_9FLAO|nr:tail fiber protein [Kaistella chaponensis]SIS79681.1 Microcystin-dependent protein [Kaistella chaponensis]